MARWIGFLALIGVGCVDADRAGPGDATPFLFEVPPGSTASGIQPALQTEGLAPGGLSWKLYVRQNPAEVTCLKAGTFELRHDMSLRQVFATLCGVPLPDDVPFTIVEGWRIRDVDAALAAAGFIVPGAYAQLANSKAVDLPFPIESPTLEGYLYPETYAVPPPGKFDPAALIVRQLDTFDDVFRSKHEGALGGRTLHEIVVMASMLEREEPSPEQRPLVAGILWKRIDKGWQLGVDATSRYDLADWNDRRAFLLKLHDQEDPYNTRIHKGLPPTAIGNPAVSSLEAALAPVASEYWYYLHDGTGTLHPSRNAAEHDALRAKYNVY